MPFSSGHIQPHPSFATFFDLLVTLLVLSCLVPSTAGAVVEARERGSCVVERRSVYIDGERMAVSRAIA